MRCRTSHARRGVVLLAVLVVVAILALVGYSFINLMNAEYEAVYASNRQSQLRALADSGVHHTAFVLSHPENAGLSDGEGSALVSPSAIFDNPQAFRGVAVRVTGPRGQGYFSIVSPRDADQNGSNSSGYRFGVVDESGKLNVQSLVKLASNDQTAKAMLQKLPNMTDQIADSLLNWSRTSGQSESASGDSMFYSSLGYSLKSGPLESLEEMLMVRGMTPRLLLGNDLNRNGILDPDEEDGTGAVDPGLSRFLTVYSREQNLNSQGQPRIYVNDTDLQGLLEKVSGAVGEDLGSLVVNYRLNTPAKSQGGSGKGNSPGGGQGGPGKGNSPGGGAGAGPGKGGSGGSSGSKSNSDQTKKIDSLFDLIDAKVNDSDGQKFENPLKSTDMSSLQDKLPLLFDMLTTSTDTERTPRININTAPREVLMTLTALSPGQATTQGGQTTGTQGQTAGAQGQSAATPGQGLTEDQVEVILDHQPGPDANASQASIYRTPAWLMTETGFKKDVVKQIEKYVTTSSQVFRVQVVGYFEANGPSVRLEAVIDTNRQRPRILYWRDISELGRGFDLRGMTPR